MRKTLGILITSEVHGAHLKAIVPAAGRKEIALHVHISGPAVRLCLQKEFQTALAHTHLTICHRSAVRLGIMDQIMALYPAALTSVQRLPLDISLCQKRIVL